MVHTSAEGRELLGDLIGEIMSANPWYIRIDISALDDEARRTILLRVKSKLGFNRILEVLSVAKSSLQLLTWF